MTGLFYSCEDVLEKKSNEQKERITITGSNTELDLVTKLISIYKNEQNPDLNFAVSGGGSNEGIFKLINGEVDIANSSRIISSGDLRIAGLNKVKPVQAIIAMDAVAIITHPMLGVDSLSIIQLRQIFAGELTNWKEVGGPDKEIKLFGRDDYSGTFTFIKDKFLGDHDFVQFSALPDQKSIVNAVRQDIGGIGYVGIGSIVDEKGRPDGSIWAVNLYIDGGQAHSPFELRPVQSGEYPLSRPLFQYFNGRPEGMMLNLLEFELSQKGQEIVRSMGYFPITDFHKQMNLDNGIYFE